MGSGQSKFGRGAKNTQYPYGAPLYSQYAPQQPFMPPYGQGFIPPGAPVFPQPQMQQYGVIPPEFYGQAAYNRPPTMMGWLPQDKPAKKRKSKRTHSENFIGGFAGEAQPDAQPRRAQSESRHRHNSDAPAMPVPHIQRSSTAHRSSKGGNHRAPTPFIPPRRDDRDEEDEDIPRGLRNNDLNRSHSRRRSPVRYETPGPIDDDIQRILRPMPSAESVVYGPKGERPRRRLTNPLPEPPRDIYEMTPYKALANLPRTSAALLATSYGSRQHLYDAENPNGRPSVKRNKSVKGILRAFSKRDKSKERDPIQIVPVFKNPASNQVQFQSQLTQPQMQMPQPHMQQPQVSQPQVLHAQMQQSQITQPQMQMPQGPNQADPLQMPPSQMQQSQITQPQMHMPQGPNQPDMSQMPSSHMQQSQITQPQMQMPQPQNQFDTPHRSNSRSSRNYSGMKTPGPNHQTPQDMQFPQPDPVPPVPSSPPPIQFNQYSPLNGFLSHSQYRVLYRNKTYPTALHLHEAMKFVDTRHEIVEIIRKCPEIHSVYPLAQQYQEFMRNDWQHKCVEFMEEVVWLKTRQHPDLRALLMNTGFARIQYSDPIDDFWGTGPTGDGHNHLGKIMTRVRDRLRVEPM